MPLKRPKPKTLSADAINNIMNASAGQTGSTKQPLTYDPNFPVFEIPVDKKALVYIPNHTMTMPDGSTTLRMDKFAAHDVRGRNTYGRIRCTSGIVSEELGLDGSCPFCDAMAEVWELYNKQYAEIAKKKGINLEDAGAKDALKTERQDLLSKKAVDNGVVWLTFPIVVIDCEEKDGEPSTTPKRDAEGKISGKVYWYSIKETTYEDKWGKALENFEDSMEMSCPTPAGLWAVLNYKVPKNQEANKMNSAKALNVSFKQMGETYNAWAEYFDRLTDEWTPAKAMETVVANVLRDGQEQKEACDEIMKGVRDTLAIYELAGGGAPTGSAPAIGGTNSASEALASFGASAPSAIGVGTGDAPTVPPAAAIGTAPQVGVTT